MLHVPIRQGTKKKIVSYSHGPLYYKRTLSSRVNLSSFIVFPVLGQSAVVFSVIVQFIFRNDNYCANYHHEKKEIEIVTGVQ